MTLTDRKDILERQLKNVLDNRKRYKPYESGYKHYDIYVIEFREELKDLYGRIQEINALCVDME